MTLTKEDLILIGDLFDQKFDQKLKPVLDRLDRLEYKQDRSEKKNRQLTARYENYGT